MLQYHPFKVENIAKQQKCRELCMTLVLTFAIRVTSRFSTRMRSMTSEVSYPVILQSMVLVCLTALRYVTQYTYTTLFENFFCVGVMYSGEYDVCDVTLSVYPHLVSYAYLLSGLSPHVRYAYFGQEFLSSKLANHSFTHENCGA